MQFIDLKAQQERIREKLEQRIKRVLDHGRYILGPEIGELEEKLAAYAGVKHCITCSSGTDALLMPLMALGVGPGDAVFVPSFTFVASAEVIAMLGATPVFVDVEADTFNIDPGALKIAIEAVCSQNSGAKPKGILAVDLFGQPADYDEINEIAASYGLFVIEDAAQSFGAEYKGKKTCSLAQVGSTSFFPAKPLGCYGDGGAVFCDDDELAAILRSVRVHGKGKDKYDNVRLGINGRFDTIQAAVLLEKLEIFDEEIELRNKAAALYAELLPDLLNPPIVKSDRSSVWAQYTLCSEKRELYQAKLKEEGIPTAVYYSKPVHLQKAYMQGDIGRCPLPITEELAAKVFSLPMHPYLQVADQEKIARVLSS